MVVIQSSWLFKKGMHEPFQELRMVTAKGEKTTQIKALNDLYSSLPMHGQCGFSAIKNCWILNISDNMLDYGILWLRLCDLFNLLSHQYRIGNIVVLAQMILILNCRILHYLFWHPEKKGFTRWPKRARLPSVMRFSRANY